VSRISLEKNIKVCQACILNMVNTMQTLFIFWLTFFYYKFKTFLGMSSNPKRNPILVKFCTKKLLFICSVKLDFNVKMDKEKPMSSLQQIHDFATRYYNYMTIDSQSIYS
jgi:hypothetical protein